jgi:hypothetical protein
MKQKNKELSVCIFCDDYVYPNDAVFHLPFDRPMRINLIVHKFCYKQKRDSGELKQFIQDNLLDYLDKYSEDLEEDYGKEKKSKKQPKVAEDQQQFFKQSTGHNHSGSPKI